MTLTLLAHTIAYTGKENTPSKRRGEARDASKDKNFYPLMTIWHQIP
jgi:hypothetical protein